MGIEPDPQDAERFLIRPSAGKWKLKEREHELFATAEDVPNWRLADKSRRLLMDMAYVLSEVVYQYRGTSVEDLEPGPAQRTATISLANLMVRSAGSAMALISCGYVPESGTPIRRCIEANLRIQAVLEDPSGQHARGWLKGQPLGTVGRLAQKYGKTEDLKLLSIYAHSGVRGLMPLLTGPLKRRTASICARIGDDPSATPLRSPRDRSAHPEVGTMV